MAGLVALLLAVAAAQSFLSLTRMRRFSHDSMTYVDVARNLRSGNGLTQSTLFYNPPHPLPALRFPAPFTVAPPAYPILIAGLAGVGLPEADAALAIPAASWPLIVLLGAWLLWRLYDGPTALWGGLLLSISHPLAVVATAAWSEAPAILATLVALLLAAHPAGRQATLAGLGAGLAFATRYLSALALPLGLLALGGRERSERLRHSAFLIAGFGAVAALVLLRNVLTTGLLSGEARNASPFGFLENLGQIVGVLSGAWCSRQEPLAQRAALGLVLAAGLAEAWQRRRSPRDSLFAGARAALAGGFVLSCGFIAFLRTRTYFDIDVRMLSLVHVLMLLSLAPLLSRLAGGRARLAGALCVLALCGRLVAVTAAITGSRPASDARALRNKPHLLWLRENANDQDLIVGESCVDVAFYLRRSSVSFYAFPPGKQYLTESELCQLIAAAQPRFRRVFLSLGTAGRDPDDAGPFLWDLLSRGHERHPELRKVADLPESVVFEASPCATSRSPAALPSPRIEGPGAAAPR